METKVEVSRFCEECLKFRQKQCEGKDPHPKNATFFGSPILSKQKLSGLDFCKLYEFDVRLYKFADGSGQAETIHTVRKRQAKKVEAVSKQEYCDDVDFGASLNLEDFAGLI